MITNKPLSLINIPGGRGTKRKGDKQQMKLLSRLKHNLSKYNKLEITLTVISSILLAWFILSFFNIVNNNMSTHTYAKWNIIIILNNYFK